MNISKEGDHRLPGKLVLVLNQPQNKNVFPDVQIEPSVFKFVLITSDPPTSLALSSLQNLHGYLHELTRSPWGDLDCTIPALSDSPHINIAPVPSSILWPFCGLSLVCPCPPCAGDTRTGHCIWGTFTSSVWIKVKDHLPSSAVTDWTAE